MNLTTKLRPKTFDKVIGQESVIKDLKKMGFPEKSVSNFFIISGKSGTGKTTIAKIMAKELNAQTIELNSTEAKLDNVRGIIELASKRPLGYDKLVIIFDEAHNIERKASESLLVFLENLPDFVYVIMCTTAPEKIIDTIKTRAYPLMTNTIHSKVLLSFLDDVAHKEKIKIDVDDLIAISKSAGGSVRESLRLLQQYQISGIVGGISSDEIKYLVENLDTFIIRNTESIINKLLDNGFSAKYILNESIVYLYNTDPSSKLLTTLINIMIDLSNLQEYQNDLLLPMIVSRWLNV